MNVKNNAEALKVQAREVETGDVLLPSRQSPTDHGKTVMTVEKIGTKVRFHFAGKPCIEHTARSTVYIAQTRRNG
jgi:hypothetical protein